MLKKKESSWFKNVFSKIFRSSKKGAANAAGAVALGVLAGIGVLAYRATIGLFK